MVDKNLLKAWIVRRGMTQGQVQKAIGIKSQATFSRKLRKNSFTLKECDAMIELLGITNPTEVFFSQN